MIDMFAYIVCILIATGCLVDMKRNFISSRGYKIIALVGAVCVLILL